MNRYCSNCGEEITKQGKYCSSCGTQLTFKKEENQVTSLPQSPQQPVVINYQEPKGSVSFAIITGVLLFLFYPLGLLLNLIGLLTGPRRGCFFSMLLILTIIPVGIVVYIMKTGIELGIPILDSYIDLIISYINKFI